MLNWSAVLASAEHSVGEMSIPRVRFSVGQGGCVSSYAYKVASAGLRDCGIQWVGVSVLSQQRG
jgi:hypothetical protein